MEFAGKKEQPQKSWVMTFAAVCVGRGVQKGEREVMGVSEERL